MFRAGFFDLSVNIRRRSTGERRFTGRVNIHQKNTVGTGERRGKFGFELRRATESMWLKHDHEPALPSPPQAREQRADFRGMMRVIFVDRDRRRMQQTLTTA